MRRIVAMLVAGTLGGCSTPVAMDAIGGSRSDGTVQMSYEYRLFQTPLVDLDQARRDAAKRCQVWGYSDAQPFGGKQDRCLEWSALAGCAHTVITISYQCVGTPK